MEKYGIVINLVPRATMSFRIKGPREAQGAGILQVLKILPEWGGGGGGGGGGR